MWWTLFNDNYGTIKKKDKYGKFFQKVTNYKLMNDKKKINGLNMQWNFFNDKYGKFCFKETNCKLNE